MSIRQDISLHGATQLDPVALALLGAADDLRQNGWLQGVWSTSCGKRCVVSAIYSHSGDHYRAAKEKIADHLNLNYDHEEINSVGGALIDWNNDPARTKEQVIRALEQAAFA